MQPMKIAAALRTCAEFLSKLPAQRRAEYERAAKVSGVTLPELVDQRRCAMADEAEKRIGAAVSAGFCWREDAQGAAACDGTCERAPVAKRGELSVIPGGMTR